MYIRADKETMRALWDLIEMLHSIPDIIIDADDNFSASLEQNRDDLGNYWYDAFREITRDVNTAAEEAKKTLEEAACILEGVVEKLSIILGVDCSPASQHVSAAAMSSSSRNDTLQELEQISAELKADMTGIINDEMVLAGSMKRRLRTPSTGENNQHGTWENDTFILNDNFIPSKKSNPEGLTVAQLKEKLREQYGLKLGPIPFRKGTADFSSISVASVPLKEIVLASSGITSEQFEALSAAERTDLFQKVFSDADGKAKRAKNFKFADQIAAARGIPIPGLPEGYRAEQLTAWREANHFSWDEQLNGGYNLVPAAIHDSVAHTGAVSTSKNAKTNLNQMEKDINEHPEKYCLDESSAPISIEQLLAQK